MVIDRSGSQSALEPSIETLRIIALVAGVALHAAAAYVTQPVPELVWAVHDPATHPAADFVFWWGRFAQVQLFFFVAGWLTIRAYASRGPESFFAAGLSRLGIPLLAGIVFVLPVVAGVWALGWTVSGRATWPEVWSWRFADVELHRNRIGPAHLWFLQDLLLITTLVAAAWRLGALRPMARLADSRVVVPGLVGLGVGLIWASPSALLAVPNTFAPDLVRVLYGATFFAGGAWLATRGRIETTWPAGALLIGIGGAATVMAVETAGVSSGATDILRAAAAVGSGWTTIFGCVCLASMRRQPLPSWSSRLSSSAHAIYILHLPVVGVMHVILYNRVAFAPMAMVTAFGATLAIAWMLALLLGRVRTWVGGTRFTRPVSASMATAAAVAIGAGLRLIEYARNPDVWHDEAALLVNVIERDYVSLLGPLTWHEAAPPLFLWLQRFMAIEIADTTWVMRLVPLLASCAALIAFVPVARTLRGAAGPAAMLLMACSTQLISHSAEAKPYAIDVLVATLAATFFVMTREWPLVRRLAICAAAAPLIIALSYPGVFVIAGLAAALAVTNLRERSRRGWLLVGLLAGVWAISAIALFAGPVRAQRSATILAEWRWAFPAGLDPISLLVWTSRSLVGLADYCFRPFGGVLLVPIGVGLAVLWRRRDAAFTALLVVPIGLAMVAGMAGQYPFSGSRVMIYALPALALLSAEGLRRIVDMLRDRSEFLRAAAIAVAVLPPVVLSARDLAGPRARPQTAAAADIVLAARRPGELVASGNWEPRYYFRHLGAEFVRLDERTLPPGHRRVWCVVHGPTAEDRKVRLLQAVGPSYRLISTVDLSGVSVIEIGAIP